MRPASVSDWPLAAPLEQLLAQLLFQSLELYGQGRRRHVQPLRCPAHAAFAGDDPEIAQVVVVEVRHGIVIQKRTIRFNL